jgi:hypothetical protein
MLYVGTLQTAHGSAASLVALRSRRAWLPSWEERVRWKVAAVAIHGASVDVVGRQ